MPRFEAPRRAFAQEPHAKSHWRRGQSGENGLNVLNGIWTDIHQRFRDGDEYIRHQILEDLAGAAIYQPGP